MSLDLSASAKGTTLRLRVHPKARKNAVAGVHGGALKVSVTSAPERGKANDAVIELLAETLGIAPSSIELVSGETSHDKVVRIPLSPEEIRERLG